MGLQTDFVIRVDLLHQSSSQFHDNLNRVQKHLQVFEHFSLFVLFNRLINSCKLHQMLPLEEGNRLFQITLFFPIIQIFGKHPTLKYVCLQEQHLLQLKPP